MTTARVIQYMDGHSASENSHYDLSLGYTHKQVGYGRSLGKTFPKRVVVRDQQGNGYLALVKRKLDPKEGVWQSKPNGKIWKFLYEATPLTDIQQISLHDRSNAGDKKELIDNLTMQALEKFSNSN
jgi:hypothetical protein